MKMHRRLAVAVVVTFVYLFFASGAMATVHTYDSTDTPKSIPDAGTTSSVITVGDSIQIQDVNVEINIDHRYASDLDVFLIHGAVTVELFTDVGGSGDNFTNTVLDDEADTAITAGSPPFTGSYKPEGKLSDFDGMDAAGDWQLRVTDDDAIISGTLVSWRLTIEDGGDGGVQEPTNPSPADGAQDVPVDVCLSWNGGAKTSPAAGTGIVTASKPATYRAAAAPLAGLTEEELAARTLVTASSVPAVQTVGAQLPVVMEFDAPSEASRGMCFDGSYLYIGQAGAVDAIHKVDPADGSVERTYGSPSGFPMGLAWDGQNFYVSGDTDRVIYVMDASFGTVVREIPVPEDWCRDMAYDGTYLWLATSRTDELWKLDPSDGTVVDTFGLPDNPGGLAWDGRHLWITLGAVSTINRISKIDPTTGQIMETYDGPGNHLTGLAWDGQYLWCVDWDGDKVYKLDTGSAPPPPPPAGAWDVYLGTDAAALQLVATDLSVSTYCPACLQPWTQYYWKVVAKGENGDVREGKVWSFTTVCPVDLNRDGIVDLDDLDIFIEKWLEAVMAP